jgi:hypothetical protein
MTALLARSRYSASSTADTLETPETSGLQDDALLISQEEPFPEWNYRIDDLLAMRQLSDDWDGIGAKAPTTSLIDGALQLARVLRHAGARAHIDWRGPPSRIVPGRNGTIIFEWQTPYYQEIEVVSPHRGESLLMIPGEATKAFGVTW